MEIASLAASAAPAATASSAAQTATLDYNSFLKLLIAQLKNQDPTNPMDSTEYIAQLATFSSVEQAIQMNARLDAILTNAVISQAESMIGRIVESPDGSLKGRVTSIRIEQFGATLILEDGEEIALTPGVTIHAELPPGVAILAG